MLPSSDYLGMLFSSYGLAVETCLPGREEMTRGRYSFRCPPSRNCPTD